jgi:Family of unknown function (DUF5995)
MPQPPNHITTFDDVLHELDRIIAWSLQNRSRIGFFAAVYKNVTARIKKAADQGEFQDKIRIELLDVTFASRYFAAIEAYQKGSGDQTAWSYALAQSKRRFTIVLQQLLLSMNPHINIDLAMATAGISTPENMLFLYPDFLKVNEILASAMLQIEKEVFTVSPILSLISKLGMKPENSFFNFSLDVARCEAWSLACELVIADGPQRTQLFQTANQEAIALGKKIVSPGLLGSLAIFFIGIFEFKSIRRIIEVLGNKEIK